MTPPDFTNEISKYQFHVTLFVLAYLAVGWLAGAGPSAKVRVLDRLAENPKLEQNELPIWGRANGLIIIRG